MMVAKHRTGDISNPVTQATYTKQNKQSSDTVTRSSSNKKRNHLFLTSAVVVLFYLIYFIEGERFQMVTYETCPKIVDINSCKRPV